MNITLTLDNRDWMEFNDQLRIDVEDFYVHGVADKTLAQEYAYRILKARKALGMGMGKSQCCYNAPIERFNHEVCVP